MRRHMGASMARGALRPSHTATNPMLANQGASRSVSLSTRVLATAHVGGLVGPPIGRHKAPPRRRTDTLANTCEDVRPTVDGARTPRWGALDSTSTLRPSAWEGRLLELLYAGQGEAAFAVWRRATSTGPTVEDLSTQAVATLALYTLLVDRDATAAADLLLLLQLPTSSPNGGEGRRVDAVDGVVAYVRALLEGSGGAPTGTGVEDWRGGSVGPAAAGSRSVTIAASWLLPLYVHALREEQREAAAVAARPEIAAAPRPDTHSVTGALVHLLVACTEIGEGLPAMQGGASAVMAATTALAHAGAALVDARDARAAAAWRAAAQHTLAAAPSGSEAELVEYIPSALLRTPAALFTRAPPSREPSRDSDGLSLFRLLWPCLQTALHRGADVDTPCRDDSSCPGEGVTLASRLVLASTDARVGRVLDLHSLVDYSGAGAPEVAGVVRAYDAAWVQRVRLLAQAPLPTAPADAADSAAAARALAEAMVRAAFAVGPIRDTSEHGADHAEARALLTHFFSLEQETGPDGVAEVASGGVACCRHPAAVEAALTALVHVQQQQQQQQRQQQLQECRQPRSSTPQAPLSDVAWRRLVARLIGRCGGHDSTAGASIAVRTHTLARTPADVNRTPALALPPLTLAGLHRAWWLPAVLGTVGPASARAYAPQLHTDRRGSGDGQRQGMSRLAARTIAAAATVEEQRRAAALLVRWAWVVESIDTLGGTPAGEGGRCSSLDAVVVAEAVAVTLCRCRTFYRGDLAGDLTRLLLLPVRPASGQQGGGESVGECTGEPEAASLASSVLAELLRAVWVAAATDSAGAPSGSPPTVDRALRWVVAEVSRGRPERLCHFPALSSLYEAAMGSTPATEPHGVPTPRAGGLAQWVSHVAEAVLDGRGGRGKPVGAAHRAELAAQLLTDSARAGVWPPTPAPLLATLRAMRHTMARETATAAAAVRASRSLLRALIEDSRTDGDGESALSHGRPSPPPQQPQELRPRQGRAPVAGLAGSYVLILWQAADTAAAAGDAATFHDCTREVAEVLAGCGVHAVKGVSARTEPWSSLWVMPPAEHEALRLLLGVYLRHHHALHVDGMNSARVGTDLLAGSSDSTPCTDGKCVGAKICADPAAVRRHLTRLTREEAPELLGPLEAAALRLARGSSTLSDAPLPHASGSRPAVGADETAGDRGQPHRSTTAAALRACSDAGDWAGAMAIVFDVYAAEPLRGIRHALRACERANESQPGVAWAGALAVWRYAQQQERRRRAEGASVQRVGGQPPRNARERRLQRRAAREAAAGRPPALVPHDRHRVACTSLLGLPEVRRIATLLAHGQRWSEALALFDTLEPRHVDGHVFAQLARALRRSPGHADAVLLLWARWRARVGDEAVPDPAMARAVVEAGLVGTRGGAADAACRLVADAARSASAHHTPCPLSSATSSSAADDGSDDNDTDPPPRKRSVDTRACTSPPPPPPARAVVPLPLDDPQTEQLVERLLCTRWYESWQSALAVAVASGRPALVRAVAAHSPLRAAIYRAGVGAVGGAQGLAALDAAGRVALAQHVVGAPGDFLSSSSSAEGGGRGGSSDGADAADRRAAQGHSRARRDAEHVEKLLKDLLGE